MRVALTFNQRRSNDEADAEFDSLEAIDSIARLVEQLGHEAIPVDVNGSIADLVERLEALAPDRIFNLAEGERGVFREAFYPALFEQLGIPHTGSPASALAICLDKALSKRVVAGARVRIPRGVLMKTIGDPIGEQLPVIVKPNFEGSSKGITAASVIRDPARLSPAIAESLQRYPDGVLVEQFIPGIDVAVGWVDGLGLLPPIWFRHDAAIYDYALKHHAPEHVHAEVAQLPPLIERRLRVAAARSFEALGVTGYGRVDFRVTPEGEVVFLEMNPLPSLTMTTGHDELYAVAAAAGYAPQELIAAILYSGSIPKRRARNSSSM
jgi:D-alanine-D-alanine ligase